MAKTTVICIKFLLDVTGQKLKSINVSRSCSKNESGNFLWPTAYMGIAQKLQKISS